MRIALGQLNSLLGDRSANERSLVAALSESRNAGADILVTPELHLSGYALADVAKDTSCTVDEVALLLDGNDVAAVVGFHERAGEERYNSAAFVEAGGLPLHVHRKLYLCDYPPFDEDAVFAPGEELRTFETGGARVAILICNDAWQPFLPALATHDGAEVLVIPAASSTEVAEAESWWRDLTRLYARLHQCYVVFVNQTGTAGGFTFWGGSHVVDPLGTIVADAGAGEAVVVAELDLERVRQRREELPLRRDLRPELLRQELARFTQATT